MTDMFTIPYWIYVFKLFWFTTFTLTVFFTTTNCIHVLSSGRLRSKSHNTNVNLAVESHSSSQQHVVVKWVSCRIFLLLLSLQLRSTAHLSGVSSLTAATCMGTQRRPGHQPELGRILHTILINQNALICPGYTLHPGVLAIRSKM
jgi:hypothetical protein